MYQSRSMMAQTSGEHSAWSPSHEHSGSHPLQPIHVHPRSVTPWSPVKPEPSCSKVLTSSWKKYFSNEIISIYCSLNPNWFPCGYQLLNGTGDQEQCMKHVSGTAPIHLFGHLHNNNFSTSRNVQTNFMVEARILRNS